MPNKRGWYDKLECPYCKATPIPLRGATCRDCGITLPHGIYVRALAQELKTRLPYSPEHDSAERGVDWSEVEARQLLNMVAK